MRLLLWVLTFVVIAAGAAAPGIVSGDGYASTCHPHGETYHADVDGDGRRDVVWAGYRGRDVGSGYFVGVCLADGMTARIPASGEGGVGLIDVEPDGRWELLIGGTSVSQVILEVVVFEDHDLRTVNGPWLVSGPGQFSEDGTVETVEGWGCQDLDHDGHRELVTAEAVRTASGASVSRKGYRLEGQHATVIRLPDLRLDRFPDAFGDLHDVLAPCVVRRE